jgi:hypothetical protein
VLATNKDKEPQVAENAVGNFKELLGALAAQQTTSVTAPALKGVIEESPDGEAVQRLVNHLSMTTSLTDTTARPLVMKALLDHPGDPGGAADELSAEAAAVIGGLDVEVSQPSSMLSERVSQLLTWILLGISGACILAISLGTAFSSGFTGSADATLAGIGIASLLVVLLLAIGFRAVAIKVASGGRTR